MGNRYILKRALTPTAGSDIWTVLSISSRRGRLIEVSVTGQGTSSAAQTIEIGRSTGGTTGGGAATPGKFDHTDQPAAAFTYNTTWAAQPTLDTHSKVMGWNALGGYANWIAPKGAGYEIRNAEQLSIRASATGVTFQAALVSMVFEED
jgi:hypothetical protein